MNSSELDLDAVDFAKGGGLVPLIAVDAIDGRILMLAYADREAIERTRSTGVLHLRSRTRGPWRKGATSGNELAVRAMHSDCDADALVAIVDRVGPACHTGTISCFDHLEASSLDRLSAKLLERVRAEREGTGADHDSASYTLRLLRDRNLRLKKLGEEAVELAVALADGDRERSRSEAADLLYHAFVALAALDVTPRDVLAELDARAHTPSRTTMRGGAEVEKIRTG